jgi:uncharacterized protein (DUF58 family)
MEKIMKKILGLMFILVFSMTILADVRFPDKPTPKPTPKGKQVEMSISVTSEVTEPTLVIKKGSIKELKAILDEAESIEDNLAIVQDENNQNLEVVNNKSSGSVQTVIGGLFLSLAFIFGGVWFVRGKSSKTIAGLFLLGVFASATVMVLANVAPPRIFGLNKSIFSEELSRRASASGKVRVKITNESGSQVKLLIPRNDENESLKDGE